MGLFITFEGGEGAGTTTQSQLLYQKLLEEGHAAILTREPGGTGVDIAEQIREILLTTRNKGMVSQTEALLFFAARAQHVKELIQPALTHGDIVISDRYNDSTLAYQGYGRGLDLRVLREITEFAIGGLMPDITFLLDAPPEVGHARKNPQDLNRLDIEILAFYRRVRQGYKILACGNPRFRIFDAEQPINEISKRVWEEVKEFLIACQN